MTRKPSKPDAKGTRAERLAAALKANLRRRKARPRQESVDQEKRPQAQDAVTPLADETQKDD